MAEETMNSWGIQAQLPTVTFMLDAEQLVGKVLGRGNIDAETINYQRAVSPE